jgi:hypothetical protein
VLSNVLNKGGMAAMMKTYRNVGVQTNAPNAQEASSNQESAGESSEDEELERLRLRQKRRTQYEMDNIDISHAQLPIGHSDDDRYWPEETTAKGSSIEDSEEEDPHCYSKESQIEAVIRAGAVAGIRFSGRPPSMSRKDWAAEIAKAKPQ